MILDPPSLPTKILNINEILFRSAAIIPSMKAEFKVPRPPCPYVMIAVPKEDFKRVNDLAEAYWIASDPDNKESIKQLRRNLVKKVHKTWPSTLQ